MSTHSWVVTSVLCSLTHSYTILGSICFIVNHVVLFSLGCGYVINTFSKEVTVDNRPNIQGIDIHPFGYISLPPITLLENACKKLRGFGCHLDIIVWI